MAYYCNENKKKKAKTFSNIFRYLLQGHTKRNIRAIVKKC